jgi:hypothetical protein
LPARVFVFFSLLYLLVGSREPPWADARVMFETAGALVERGELDLQINLPPVFYVLNQGQKFGGHAIGNVVAQVPGYLVYKLLDGLTNPKPPPPGPPPVGAAKKKPPGPPPPVLPLAAHLGPSLAMAAALALFFLLCRRQGASARWALTLTGVLGLGTLCLVYARQPYGEAVQTLLVLVVVDQTLRAGEQSTPRRWLFVGLALALLLSTKPVYVVLVPVIAAYLVWIDRARPRRALVHLTVGAGPVALGMCIILLHNFIKTGDLLDAGYPLFLRGHLMDGDLLPNLYGYLLSPGKGLVFYAPPVAFGLYHAPRWLGREGARAWLIAGIVAVIVVMNAKFWLWHGDYCWGPRFLVPVVPLLILPAAAFPPSGWARGAFVALAGAGLVVQILGASLYWDHYIRAAVVVRDQLATGGWFEHHLSFVHFIPQFSPISGHAWLLAHLFRRDPDLAADVPWQHLVTKPLPLADVWSRLRVDFWPLDWFETHPLAGALLLALFFAATVAAGWSLARRLRREA